MSIHRTKSGSYEVRWRDKGRQRAKCFKRSIDAKNFEAKVNLGQLPEYLKDPMSTSGLEPLNFEDLAETWIRDHSQVHNAPSSVMRNQQILKTHLLPYIGRIEVDSVCKRDFVQLQARLSKQGTLSAKTINNILGLANKICVDGLSWGLLQCNPCAGLKRIKAQEQDHRFWEFVERDRFLDYARTRNPALHDLVAFTINTGLRRGEVEGLMCDCIDYDRQEIIVRRNYCHKTAKLNDYTKGKTIRRVPMNAVVWELMKEHRLKSPRDKIFNFDFQHLVTRHFKPMQLEAGVKIITFHDLRHSFASHLAMSGVSLFDIQKVLGHSDLKTTQRYMHLAPDHLQGITEVLVRPGKSLKPSKDDWRKNGASATR